jgi:predicted Zn-dependent protease
MPEATVAWDVEGLTADQETRLGESLHRMVLYSVPEEADGTLAERVENAAKELRPLVNRRAIRYQFTVLASDAVNAFSLPGGFVYVTRGLFDLISEDEDYMLTFVLAHEMGHVDRQHALKCLAGRDLSALRDPADKDRPMSTWQKFQAFLIPLAYPDEMDFEADRWAFDRMVQMDFTRREILAFLRKLDRYAFQHGFGTKRAIPPSVRRRLEAQQGGRSTEREERDRDLSDFDNHVRAHVSPRARLERMKALAEPATATK